MWWHLLDILSCLHSTICQCTEMNSLWPSDTIWRHRSGSTLAQVIACCLMAPGHNLNQYWLSLVSSSDIQLRAISQEIPHPPITEMTRKLFIWNLIQTSQGQWVNPEHAGTKLIWFNIVNMMVANALAPCITRTSVSMILNIQLPVSCQYGRMTLNGNICFCSLWKI